MNIEKLLGQAFFEAEAESATPAIESARERFSQLSRTDGFSFEVVAPQQIDEQWLRESLLQPLVYFCESVGSPLPACPGVFVSLFYDSRVHFIVAAEVIAWAEKELQLTTQELGRLYGTHEADTALR